MKASKLLALATSIIMVAILLLVCFYCTLQIVQAEVAITYVSTVNKKDKYTVHIRMDGFYMSKMREK